VRALLGEGGQGWVFKANYDEPDGFWIVVKILRPEGLTPETLHRFEREIRVLQMLGQVPAPNPNIVRFYDHGLHRIDIFSARVVLPFIALEYVEGSTLRRAIDEARQGLPLARVIRVMRQVARALVTVHDCQIVHRDLKPSNILLAEAHGQEVAKITDFGLVKVGGMSTKSTATIAGATVGYAPPEQFEMGNNRVGPRTDVFSFATILYEALSGSVAFPHMPGDSVLKTVARMLSGERPQLTRVASSLSPELRGRHEAIARVDAELARATAADPDARHASMNELWSAVEPALRGALSVPQEVDDAPTIPQPQRFSGLPQTPAQGLTMKSSRDRWTIAIPALPRERFRSATFDPERGIHYAVGLGGIYRGEQGHWARMPLPTALDARRARGIAWLRADELLVYGDAGLAVILGPGESLRSLPQVDGDFNWFGAFTQDGDCVIAGERRARAVGVVAEVADKAAHVHTVPRTTRLLSATRLASGDLLACGVHGDLARINPSRTESIAWGRTGHLLAIARNESGGAFVVGTGGHALALSPERGPGQGPGDLEVVLEQVQTTRDLTAVELDASGTPWAVGHAARLLVRRQRVWTRLAVEGTTASLVSVHPTAQRLTIVAEDGTVLEARWPLDPA